MEPEGIWIIGTTHVSQESASDVERVIRAVKPENVVVELCRSRQVLAFVSFNFVIFSIAFMLCTSRKVFLPLIFLCIQSIWMFIV